MADIQLAIAYQPPSLRPAFVTVVALKWLVVIVVPGMFLIATIIVLLVPSLRVILYSGLGYLAFLVAFIYCVAVGVGAAFTWPLTNSVVKVSKEGVVLPFLATAGRRLKASHIWSEFTSASISNARDGAAEKLLLGLDTGQKVVFDTDGFDKTELEQLLLGIELWGTSMTRSPELIDYQQNLQNETKGLEVNYTRMWEEELSRRFKATSFMPLEPGHKLQKGRLEVLKQLAFGGLSAIYLVQRDGVDMFVLKEAVVPMDANLEQRRQAEQHLARESQMLFGLAHPNIAHVLDYFVEDERNYLLLEYINGQDLRQLVKQNGPQSEAQVTCWARQIADALSFIHSQEPPVMHRDVSPDNMVLRNNGTLVLIDFGAANEFIGTATGTLIGKQAYMAPEQLRGKSTCQSDIYGFGACLFFLLTARDPMPLSACRPSSVLPTTAIDLDNLIASMTAPEQSERISGIDEVISTLSMFSAVASDVGITSAGENL